MKSKLIMSFLFLGLGYSANAAKIVTAEIQSKSNSAVKGKVTFEPAKGGSTLVKAEVSGLTPNSSHGFHVHEHGDCSAANADSAGDHYNPAKKAHGGASGERHKGDLENLVADANGVAKYERTFAKGTLPVPGLRGRSVVVHEKPDDLSSQPAGDSGARIGCGVIK